jgi:sugar-specific transcriptional regulator TrmB
MNIEKSLEKLGLSSNDAAIYTALLKHGESPVRALILDTGFHREIIYSSLQRLEKQGLAQSMEKKKVRYYQACSPEIFKSRADEQAKLAKDILPTLLKIQTINPLSVKIYEGQDGLEEIEKDWAITLKDGEEFYCIGGAGSSWYEVAKPFYKKYHNKLAQRGIKVKTVTYPREYKEIQGYEDQKFNPVRILPQTHQSPASTVIYGNKVLLQLFGEQYVGIVITSNELSKAYLQQFKLLWSIAKKA